jgi:hypothetical protein
MSKAHQEACKHYRSAGRREKNKALRAARHMKRLAFFRSREVLNAERAPEIRKARYLRHMARIVEEARKHALAHTQAAVA